MVVLRQSAVRSRRCGCHENVSQSHSLDVISYSALSRFLSSLQRLNRRNSDGLIDFDEFRVMDKAFPLLFFPAFKLQDSLQRHFLGGAKIVAPVLSLFPFSLSPCVDQ